MLAPPSEEEPKCNGPQGPESRDEVPQLLPPPMPPCTCLLCINVVSATDDGGTEDPPITPAAASILADEGYRQYFRPYVYKGQQHGKAGDTYLLQYDEMHGTLSGAMVNKKARKEIVRVDRRWQASAHHEQKKQRRNGTGG